MIMTKKKWILIAAAAAALLLLVGSLTGASQALLKAVWPSWGSVKLPSGEVVTPDQMKSMETTILGKIKESNQKLNDLESAVRRRNTEIVDRRIPEALAEKEIRKSVERMVAAW